MKRGKHEDNTNSAKKMSNKKEEKDVRPTFVHRIDEVRNAQIFFSAFGKYVKILRIDIDNHKCLVLVCGDLLKQ